MVPFYNQRGEFVKRNGNIRNVALNIGDVAVPFADVAVVFSEVCGGYLRKRSHDLNRFRRTNNRCDTVANRGGEMFVLSVCKVVKVKQNAARQGNFFGFVTEKPDSFVSGKAVRINILTFKRALAPRRHMNPQFDLAAQVFDVGFVPTVVHIQPECAADR